MAGFGIEQPTAVVDADRGEELTPADLANRVAELSANGRAAGAGSAPLWSRVNERRPSWFSRLIEVVAWCGTLALLAIAVLRIAYHDGVAPLIWLNAFTFYVYLPVYAVLAYAVWRKRWWLAGVAGAVVTCHIAWVAPDFQPATTYEPPANTTSAAKEPSRPIRIFYANVRATNEDFGGILKEIAAADPDVVVFAEFYRIPMNFRSPEWKDVLMPYKYGTSIDDPHPDEVVVFSRLPISRHDRLGAAGRVCHIIDIPLGEQSLSLFCLHSPRPYSDSPLGYNKFWESVTPAIAEQSRPLIVIGDFNASQHSQVLKELESNDLRSAHVDRGRGYVVTWPNGENMVPPIRIDHALLSADVECLGIEEGVGEGSDHKPLILDVRVHPGEEPAIGAEAER